MELKRIAPLSAMKVGFGTYAAIGLFIGGIFSLLGLVGMGMASIAGDAGFPEGVFGIIFGLGAVILLPIFYGIMGAIGAGLMSLVYNLVARTLGGLELELE